MLTSIKILLVDDHNDTLEALQIQLCLAGANVQIANTGQAALAVVEKWQPDILILDLMMPEMDGYTLLPKLRKVTGDIPAIALTAIAGAKIGTLASQAGFNALSIKPKDLGNELIVTIARLLARLPAPTQES